MSMPRHHRILLAVALAVSQGFPLLAKQSSPSAPAPSGRTIGASDVPAQAPARRPLTGARQSAFGEIEVRALDSGTGLLPHSVVRLRDTRTGRITDTKLTDASGTLTFLRVEPGNYVAELVLDNGKVLAASQLITVDAGDALSTIVKLPMRVRSLAGLIGNKAGAAAIVAGTAAAAGVLATRISDCVSPPCAN